MTLAFRLGSIPVRIHGSFFLTTLLLAAGRMNQPKLLLIWTLIVLGSVLLHELGHAVAGHLFGLAPEIDLHAMGGTTSWTWGRGVSDGKSIAISLAGPAVGLVLAGVVLAGLLSGFQPETPLAHQALWDLAIVNGYWGLVNLLPVLPLDGGNVTRSVLRLVTKGGGEKATRWVSFVVAVLLTLGFLVLRNWFAALLFGMFAVQNFRGLREAGI
ncbi:MAG: site-2 protease family protein [Myxococcales bacterium]